MRGRWRWVLVGVAVVALFVGVRLALAYNQLRHGRGELASAEAQLRAHDIEAADAALDRARLRFARAYGDSRGLGLRYLAAVPLVGSPAQALADAARAAQVVADAGRLLAHQGIAVEDAAKAMGADYDLSAVHAALGGAAVSLREAETKLATADAILAGPAGAWLPPIARPAQRLRTTVADVRAEVSGARRGLGLLHTLTDPTRTTRLLVLNQDTFELRPTGGFVGSYGVLRIERAKISLDRFDAIESLPPPNPVVVAPVDLEQALYGPWSLGDANWWPDFPYSAANARAMYQRQGGAPVDGVVALTENQVGRLIDVVGGVTLPGYAPVSGKDIGRRIVAEVEQKIPPDVPRKKFLIELAHAVLDRALHPAAGEAPAIAHAFADGAGAGDVQAWFADPSLQRELAGTAWSGELPRPAARDFLMLVDANMSGSKANADLVRKVTYRVEQRDGRLVARLDVRYRNNGPASEAQNPYYNGFLRVYAPRGARLVGDRIVARNRGVAPDGDYQVFSARVYAEPGGSDHVRFDYVLPRSVSAERYRLLWLRQAGTPADELVATIGGSTTTGDPAQRELRTAHRF